MKSSPSILVVSHTSGMAGAEMAILETMVGLMGRGYAVHCIVPQEGMFASKLRELDIPFEIIYSDQWTAYGQWPLFQKLRFLKGYWLSALKISRYASRVGAEVIISNTSTIISGALAARFAGIPHIHYLHEFVVEDHGLTWQYGERRSYKLIGSLSAGIVTTSNAVKEKASKYIDPKKLNTVYCACLLSDPDLETQQIHSEGVKHLLMTGSISAGKNQAEAIKALGILKQNGIILKLDLVGHKDSTYWGYLQHLADAEGVLDQVELHPFTNHLSAIFKPGGLLVVASRQEAFGRVIAEAQKAGLAVVAAAAGGVIEIVENNVTGLTYAPGHPDDLADKIRLVWEDASLYVKLAKEGKKSALEKFNLNTHLNEMEKVINAC